MYVRSSDLKDAVRSDRESKDVVSDKSGVITRFGWQWTCH